jgi:hypothetical protein
MAVGKRDVVRCQVFDRTRQKYYIYNEPLLSALNNSSDQLNLRDGAM